MAHFYGNLKGSRGEATRCGTRQSGIRVSARSWKGSISVELRQYEPDSDPIAIVRVSSGSAAEGEIIFSGSIAEFRRRLTAPDAAVMSRAEFARHSGAC